MQTIHDLVQAVFEAPCDRVHAENQPLFEQRTQVQNLWFAVDADHVHVDAVVALQLGGGKQVVHQLLEIHPV